jgi:hypothetical protein
MMRRLWPFAKLPHSMPVEDLPPETALQNLKLRWKRRRLLWRSFRSRRDLTVQQDRTACIAPDAILCFACLRNEAQRLPYFLNHLRRLGVTHFLCVDNGSDDGSRDYLTAQPDVSLWATKASYNASRFGVDWLTWLQIKYGHGHWCLTLDVDEILTYPDWPNRDLRALTDWMDAQDLPMLGAMMLDLYPKGPLGAQSYAPGQDPTQVLQWFDAGPYRQQVQPVMRNLWVQGGVRERVFFADQPQKSPTLNKIPLVKWNRRYAYVNSTHSILPARLNATFAQNDAPSAVLLHTKFLPSIVDKSAEEKQRGEHFTKPAEFDHYYDGLIADPDLWCEASTPYHNWLQLVQIGLMRQGKWR